ncbi:MAG: excinuclease ABC subunit UvrC [Desulfuromonadales bacterium]|nr:excinuclease ABC subunit UvrC [Desulfuromonadales bacterium]
MTAIDLPKQPTSSGVYLMKDEAGEVLYVGKAKNLRARLRSYLKADRDSRPQIKFLMERTAEVETIVTDTEKEALILENTLIKQHRPRYNIHLRDDKTFVSLRFDLRADFPLLEVVRRVKQDGARYFGPFASSVALRQTLKEIYRIFPLRHYPEARCRQRGRPCLFHQIGQCSAPCHGLISKADYRHLVDGVLALLEGRNDEVLKLLQQRMEIAAQALRYEDAALLRDQVRAIERTIEQQKAVRHGGLDQDVVGFFRQGGEVELTILFYRQGRLNARRSYNLDWRQDEQELLAEFLTRFYGREVPIPNQLLLPFSVDSLEVLQDWLSERRQRKVKISVPKRGERLALVEMANRNAAESLRERGSREQARRQVLEDIKQRLHLPRIPKRIECFDISTIHGQATVGSMAVVIDGEPASSEYRHYKVKTVVGTDDYAALREVLERRLRRGCDEGGLPDFILIDGGRGQLGVVAAVLEQMQLSETISLAGIAKSRVQANARGKVVERSEERFFLPGRKNPLVLRRGSPSLFLLERLRDEAHRFAITHHRKLRGKAQIESVLGSIDGVGPKRQRALLKHFGSLKKIRSAELSELQQTPGLPESVAEQIYQYFRSS